LQITEIETFPIEPRWLVLAIRTDEGITGYGEPTLEGHLESVQGALEEFERYLKGKDPRRIEKHWQTLYRGGFYRGGPVLTTALSGVEQALWDIKGKKLGVPVYELLGGPCRDKIEVYAHVHGDRTQDYIDGALEKVERDFRAFKTTLAGPARSLETPQFLQEAVDKVGAIREALGPEVQIGVDLHGRYSPAAAIQAAQSLEKYNPAFIEEPCLPGDVDSLARIQSATAIPVATGERLYTKWGFRSVIEKGAADVLQPDLSHAGGILEGKKIGAMAEARYASLAPHCPLGPVALAACIQLDACTPNFLIQEQVTLGERYLEEPFSVENGFIPLPEDPGLGIEVNEDALREGLLEEPWQTPSWTHEDGSVADW